MYRLGKLLITLCIVSIFFLAFAFADVPGLMSYQGILKDSEGDPVSTVTTIIITIYDDATASDPANIKWQETHLVTPDENGLFTAILGQGVVPIAITDDVFDSPDRWLGVQIQGDDEQTPRTRIVASAYSHRVSTVDGSSGGTISGDVSIASDLAVDGDLNATGKATIGTGHTNTGAASFVVGENNTASGANSTITGGANNVASGEQGTIGGGTSNEASGLQSTIAGGYAGNANGESSAIGGGWHNTANGAVAVVSGGEQNTAQGNYSTVGGGFQNMAYGFYSTVPGGQNNYAGGFASFAAGLRAKANHHGVFVWGDNTDADFNSTADNQFIVRASGGVGIGTNNPTSALHVVGEAKCEVGGVEFYMVPQGAIIMWSGSLASIPSGWVLCDGTNGTPDLRNRFIYGADTGEDPGGTGGSATIPAHNHSVDIAPFSTSATSWTWYGAPLAGVSEIADYRHTHTVDPPATFTNTQPEASNIPPYYKLAFIMKL